MASAESIDKHIASLVEVTESILRGEYDKWEAGIDAEGMLSVLAQKINTLIRNLKNVETPLTSAGEQAPTVALRVKNVIELMATAAGQVLDNADRLSESVAVLETNLQQAPSQTKEVVVTVQKELATIKSCLFDIIGSQSFQDVARQKMEVMISDLNQIRDWLVEVLLILNIRKDSSPENVQKKTEILKGVSESTTSEDMKQDLVDDLLAEFGY